MPIELLKAAGSLMHHRGPDNFAWIISGRLGMTHNRLSLLDLSALAHQPFANEDYILSYNGEIYNFQALRKRLATNYRVQFKTTSDTEVLFHSLINDGVETCLRHIKGMFAFAFYDKRKEELWLVRDRLGIKPLYYVKQGDSFYWASEIKALVKTLNIPLDSVKALLSINGLGERSRSHTLFKDVYAVRPGSFLKISANGTMQYGVYYDVADDFDLNYYRELEKYTAAQIVAEFETLFADSINRMLISDAPMGVFVSGGVDSSLIAVMARAQYPHLKLFTANILGRFSEFTEAQSVAQHIGLPLYDYKFEPAMILRDWVTTTYYYESPIVIHTNAIAFANVARLAHEAQVKAVLTGEGADELFLGYPKLLTRRYRNLALLPDTILKSCYRLVPGLAEYLFPSTNGNVVNFAGNLVQNFESQQLDWQGEDEFAGLTKTNKEEQKMTLKMLNEHLVTLLHRNDRMGMMSSIEARFPFLDETIIKFAINLPAKFKIGHSRRFHNFKHPFLIDKWVVRKTAEKYLPSQIAYKKKFGFSIEGHNFMRFQEGFFANGWFSEQFGLDAQTIRFMLQTQAPYFIAKLASVEIFGRIFAQGQPLNAITNHVLKYAAMVSD